MVFEKIREIIAEQTGKDINEITPETNFREDLNADSLDLFQIINGLEEEFNIHIDEMEKVVTVADAIKFIEEHS